MKKSMLFEADVDSWKSWQDKLDHYNAWLANNDRKYPYPGFPKPKLVGHIEMETQANNVDVQPVVKAPKAKAAKTPTVEKAEKGPREGSKLSKAVEVVQSTGKDDKEACIQAIVSALAVTRGNASIYYTKAKAILG